MMVVYKRDGRFSVSVDGLGEPVEVSAELDKTETGLQLTAELNKHIRTSSSLVIQDSHTLHMFTPVSMK